MSAIMQGDNDLAPTEQILGTSGGKRSYTLFQGHSGPVYSATFSPLGDFILSSSADSTSTCSLILILLLFHLSFFFPFFAPLFHSCLHLVIRNSPKFKNYFWLKKVLYTTAVRLWSTKLNANLVCYKGHNYPVWDVQVKNWFFLVHLV